ncbi:MAG TPA: hypothetical protein DCG50_06710 [Elusimicrobia bacterium]|nr:hypothetical protein [Elusimicrobiota bacterium]
MRGDSGSNDFEDLLKDSELDSAKMILRLTSELKEKEQEMTALRTKTFENMRSNNKAKEEEFEALMKAQEDRIKKREQEIGRLLVEKESALWQKYQKMLDDSVATHRGELEEERARLNGEVSKKEGELARQKKALRLEMEEMFKKWEAEREEDFKNERETFIAELKLGRETARKEAAERIAQMEGLFKEKLVTQASELDAAHQLEKEELKSRLRQERAEELKKLSDALSAEFEKKDRMMSESHKLWMADNKKLLEEKHLKRLAQAERDYGERIGALTEALKKAEAELPRREKLWADRNEELKKSFIEKEAALELSSAQAAELLARGEKKLSERHNELNHEILLEKERLQTEFFKKEKNLEQAFTNKTAEFAQVAQVREQGLSDRENRLLTERGELNKFREQIGQILSQRQAELQQTLDERYALLRQSLEESYKIKELSLLKKYEDIERQFSVLNSQKDAALSKAAALAEELARFKNAADENENNLRADVGKERTAIKEAQLLAEAELSAKYDRLAEELAGREKTIRADYEKKLAFETQKLTRQLEIKEESLNEQAQTLNRQANELENRLIAALKSRDAEAAQNLKKHTELLRAQAAQTDARHTAELEAAQKQAEQRETEVHAAYENLLRKREADLEAAHKARSLEREISLRRFFELEKKKLEETHLIKLSESETTIAHLTESLKSAEASSLNAALGTSKVKEELELLTMRLEEKEQEKQKLLNDGLHKSGELRQAIEQQYLEKITNIEKNYLSQIADTIKHSEDSEKAGQNEYFRKLEFMKEEYRARLESQAKDIEEAYLATRAETYRDPRGNLQTERKSAAYPPDTAGKKLRSADDRKKRRSLTTTALWPTTSPGLKMTWRQRTDSLMKL